MLEPKNSTILIADDDAEFRRRLKHVFAKTAYQLHEAEEISAALRFIKQHRPTLIVVSVTAVEDFGARLARRVKSDDTLSTAFILQISPESLVDADGTAKNLNYQSDAVFYEPFNAVNFLSYVNSLIQAQNCENNLRLRDERYRTLMAANSQIVWSADADGISRELTDWWKSLTGQSADDAAGWGWLDMVHGDDRDRVQLSRQYSIDTRSPYLVEYRVLASDKTFHHVAVRCFPVFNEDKSFREWIGTITDITAQKETEAVFSQQNALLELSHEPVFVWSYEAGIISWNRGCAELYGFTKEETIGKDSRLLLQTEYSASHRAVKEALEKEGQWSGELRRRTRDGRPLFIESRQMLTSDGDGRQLILESNRDITDRRQAEERYRAFIEQSSEGIWRIEVEPPFSIKLPFDEQIELAYERAFIAECNEAMARMYGFDSAESLVGTPLSQLFVESDPANYLYLRSFMESGYRLSEAESHERDADGHDLYFLNNLVGIVVDNHLMRVWGTQRNITERKRAEKALRENENLVRQALAVAQMQAWDLDLETKRIVWSQNAETVTGFDSQTFGDNLEWALSIVHPEDKFIAEQAIDNAVETGKYTVENRIINDAGETVWLFGQGEVVYDEEIGAARRIVGVSQNITERKEAENRLRRSEQQFVTLAAAMPQLVWTATRKGEFDYLNGQWREYFAAPLRQFADADWREILHPDDLLDMLDDWKRCLKTGEPLEVYARFHHKSGEYRWQIVRGVPLKDDDGKTAQWIGTCTDIHNQREVERALRESEERMSLAMRIADIGTWDYNAVTGKLIWSNSHFTMFGYPPSHNGEATGEMWRERIHPDDLERVIQTLEKAERERTLYENEYRIVRFNDGKTRWISTAGQHFYDEAGNTVRFVGVFFDITERREVEARIRRANERFQIAEEAANGFLYDWDVLENKVERSATFSKVLGYNAEENALSAEGWQDFIHPDDYSQATRRFYKALETDDRFATEYRVRHKNGDWIHVLDRGMIFRDEEGRPVRVIGSTVDINERKQIENALRESEERQRLLTENLNSIFWIFDWQNNRVEYFSPAFEKVIGYERDYVLNKRENWFSIIHPQDFESSDRAFKEIETTGRYENEYRIVRPDGAVRWLHDKGQPIYNENGEIERIIGVAEDVTARREISDALRQSQMQLKLSTDAAQISPWRWEMATNKVTLSPLHAKLWGISEAELTAADFSDWAERVHPEDREKAHRTIELARNKHLLYESEYRLVRRDDQTVRWMRSLGTFKYDDAGQAVEMYGVDYDITEPKIAEQEREKLIESERRAREDAEFANRAKDEFLAVLSHELRTPLNAMYGWARMLSAGTLDEAMQKRALEVIERNIQLQSKLIEDILDVSRIVSGKIKLEPHPLDLAALVKAAAEMSRPTANQKQVNLETNVPDEFFNVNGDNERLQQVLSNLINNSIKFTPAQGTVSVTLENENDFAQIIVADTGIGIDAEFLPHVFDRFRQADASSKRKHGGLGLGLAIVKHLVELHGGSVKAESAGEGRGAKFIVFLPLEKASAEAEKQQAEANFSENGSAAHSRFENLRILILEDDPDAVEVLRVNLNRSGARTECFNRAADALEALQNNDFDLILSDVGLPEMDGLEFIERVREIEGEKFKTLPALAITAYASAEDRERVISAGFNDCLAKPVSFDALENAAAQALGMG